MRNPPITVNIPSVQRENWEGEYFYVVDKFMGGILGLILNQPMYKMGGKSKIQKETI